MGWLSGAAAQLLRVVRGGSTGLGVRRPRGLWRKARPIHTSQNVRCEARNARGPHAALRPAPIRSITVATYDYAQLVVNPPAACIDFSGRSSWWPLTAARTWLQCRATCVEPESLGALPKDAYVLKLRWRRARPSSTPARSCSTRRRVRLEPSLPEGGPSLLGGFQDKRCVPTAERSLATARRAATAKLTFATPILRARRGGRRGAAARVLAARRSDEIVWRPGGAARIAARARRPRELGLPAMPQFVRSMQWCWPERLRRLLGHPHVPRRQCRRRGGVRAR